MSDLENVLTSILNPDAIPVPKYRVGQKVYYGTAEETREAYDCPDCLGSGQWKLVSPAGLEAKAKCPRCEGQKQLAQRSYKGAVHEVLIGGITLRTHANSYDAKIQYEFNRTGDTYNHMNEDRLYATMDAAQTVADQDAAMKLKALNDPDTRQGQDRQLFRDLSKHQLIEAATKESESKAWHANYSLNRMIERIGELTPESYLMSDDVFKEDLSDAEKKVRIGSATITLSAPMIALLQEHLMGYDADCRKRLMEYRREAKECKCP